MAMEPRYTLATRSFLQRLVTDRFEFLTVEIEMQRERALHAKLTPDSPQPQGGASGRFEPPRSSCAYQKDLRLRLHFSFVTFHAANAMLHHPTPGGLANAAHELFPLSQI
jgi:hypothetical protein